jgi:hypothetical protein
MLPNVAVDRPTPLLRIQAVAGSNLEPETITIYLKEVKKNTIYLVTISELRADSQTEISGIRTAVTAL